MEIVYIVSVCNVENNSIKSIHKTKEGAEKSLFKQRDILIKHWRYLREEDKLNCCTEMWNRMIKNISGNDYENWNNYPHDIVVINEFELQE